MMWYVVTAILWGVYAGRQQVFHHGWSWFVPLVVLVNLVFCPLTIIVASFYPLDNS